MTERTRNLAVGLTVLVAFAMLGGMVLLFTGLPEIFRGGRVLRMNFNATHDVRVSDWVHLAGMRVGKVTDISFAGADPRDGVIITARIDEGVRVPANVEPQIHTRGVIGGAYLTLAPVGEPRTDPATGEPMAFLPPDYDAVLHGRHIGSSMMPKALTEGLESLSELAKNLNELIAPSAATQPSTGPATAPATRRALPPEGSVRGAIVRLSRALEGIDRFLGDRQAGKDFKVTMANLAEATGKASAAMTALRDFADSAGRAADDMSDTIAEAKSTVGDVRKIVKGIGGTIDKYSKLADTADRNVAELSGKLSDSAEKLSKLLMTINRIATKIEAGEGTAGRLVADPKLYQRMTEASAELANLLKDFRGLVEQWKRQGVGIKLK